MQAGGEHKERGILTHSFFYRRVKSPVVSFSKFPFLHMLFPRYDPHLHADGSLGTDIFVNTHLATVALLPVDAFLLFS